MADQTLTHKLTAADYLAQYPETTQPMELIGGEVIVMPPPKDLHQFISMMLSIILGQYVMQHQLGALRAAPTGWHLDEYNALQPDLFFVLAESARCTLRDDGYWHGAPDLCIEIVSPSSIRLDRLTKYALYQQNQVREYWIIEPEARFIETYVLHEGQFQNGGRYTERDTLTSQVVTGFTLAVASIFPPEKGDS